MSNNCGYEFQNSACASDIYVNVNDGAVIINNDPCCPDPRLGQIRVPVKVAILDITKVLLANIFICEGFEDIKHIQRHVFLTDTHATDKFLYVKGFVEENVGYATPILNPNPCHLRHHHCNVINNKYNDCTARIDFDFTVPVNFDTCRCYNSQLTEGSYHGDCTNPCDHGCFGELPCQKSYSRRVILNEPIKGVLEEYSFNECVTLKRTCCETPWQYDTIEEILELTLVIALVQTQQLPSMPCPPPYPPCGEPCNMCPPPCPPPYPPCGEPCNVCPPPCPPPYPPCGEPCNMCPPPCPPPYPPFVEPCNMCPPPFPLPYPPCGEPCNVCPPPPIGFFATLSGSVWSDGEACVPGDTRCCCGCDGFRGAEQFPLPGIEVKLYRGMYEVADTITDVNGAYEFIGLPAGNDYRVRFILPRPSMPFAYKFAPLTSDNDANPDGFTNLITVIDATPITGIDAGICTIIG